MKDERFSALMQGVDYGAREGVTTVFPQVNKELPMKFSKVFLRSITEYAVTQAKKKAKD